MSSHDSNPYRHMKVTLRRVLANEWLMFAEDEGSICASATMYADEATALSRASTLAGWFDAELVVERLDGAPDINAMLDRRHT